MHMVYNSIFADMLSLPWMTGIATFYYLHHFIKVAQCARCKNLSYHATSGIDLSVHQPNAGWKNKQLSFMCVWCDWCIAYDIQSLLHSDEVDNSTYQDIKNEMAMSTSTMTCVGVPFARRVTMYLNLSLPKILLSYNFLSKKQHPR